MFICTSHDEGLGFPCWRRNTPAFRSSPRTPPFSAKCWVSPASTSIPPTLLVAAAQIAAALSNKDWRVRYETLAVRNLARWNDLARGDRDNVISLIARLAHP